MTLNGPATTLAQAGRKATSDVRRRELQQAGDGARGGETGAGRPAGAAGA